MMRRMSGPSKAPLAGTRIAITRPAGSGAALARRARALGGEALSLPGSSLREAADPRSARSALAAALAADIAILTSPAAVRFAARLRALRTRAVVLAPGRGTAQALRRAGLRNPVHPGREDSEGLLALPVLRHVRGKRIGIVGAAGGRGLLQRELAARGARIIEAQVYRRVPARLDRRHAAAASAPAAVRAAVECGSAGQPACGAARPRAQGIAGGHRGGQQRAHGNAGARGGLRLRAARRLRARR